MGCFVALLALLSPRLALFALWLFSDLLGRRLRERWVPLLGFFLLPWTTLAYAVMWVSGTSRSSASSGSSSSSPSSIDLSSWSQSGRICRGTT